MNRFLAALAMVFVGPVLCAQTYTYTRPSLNSDAGTIGASAIASCLTGESAYVYTNYTSDLSAVYSGKSGAGPVGSSATLSYLNNHEFYTYYAGRTFSGFTAFTSTSSYFLHVTASSSVTGFYGETYIAYSTDTGSTFNCMQYFAGPGSTGGGTLGASLSASVNLANLEVFAVVSAHTNDSASGGVSTTSAITIQDIWVSGTSSPGGAGKDVIWFTKKNSPIRHGLPRAYNADYRLRKTARVSSTKRVSQ